MKVPFYKYHGAGNDFVMIDGRNFVFPYKNKAFVRKLCDRRLGIGADGMIILTKPKKKGSAVGMIYLNSDGSIGAMCGNGGRCIVRFAYDLGLIPEKKLVYFDAVDGMHEATLQKNGKVNLKMIDMQIPQFTHGRSFTFCGTTPHYMTIVDDIFSYPLVYKARAFRDRVKDVGGINLNIIQQKGSKFFVRTYERGVEDETLACGTGACSVATFLYKKGLIKNPKCEIVMPGGTLAVSFTPTEKGFENVWLSGPTEKVFQGKMEI